MQEAVILHNELLQFREMTHLHAQNVRERIGADVNGLQTRIVLQTQLLHILLLPTVRTAIQMCESGGQGRERLGIREAVRIIHE